MWGSGKREREREGERGERKGQKGGEKEKREKALALEMERKNEKVLFFSLSVSCLPKQADDVELWRDVLLGLGERDELELVQGPVECFLF